MKPLTFRLPIFKKFNNTTGHPHISHHAATGKFRADIKVQDQRHYIGLYDSVEEALAAQVRGLSTQLEKTEQEVDQFKTENFNLTTHMAELVNEISEIDKDLTTVHHDFDAFMKDLRVMTDLVSEFAQLVQKPEVQQVLAFAAAQKIIKANHVSSY